MAMKINSERVCDYTLKIPLTSHSVKNPRQSRGLTGVHDGTVTLPSPGGRENQI